MKKVYCLTVTGHWKPGRYSFNPHCCVSEKNKCLYSLAKSKSISHWKCVYVVVLVTGPNDCLMASYRIPWPQLTLLLSYQHVIPFPVTPKQRCDCLWLSSSCPTVPFFASLQGLGSITQIRNPPPLLHSPPSLHSNPLHIYSCCLDSHCVTLYSTQACAFLKCVQSIHCATGGLQSCCRHIWRKMKAKEMHMTTIWSAKGLRTFVQVNSHQIFQIRFCRERFCRVISKNSILVKLYLQLKISWSYSKCTLSQLMPSSVCLYVYVHNVYLCIEPQGLHLCAFHPLTLMTVLPFYEHKTHIHKCANTDQAKDSDEEMSRRWARATSLSSTSSSSLSNTGSGFYGRRRKEHLM